MKIIVLNLNRTTTEAQLTALFSEHGEVKSATIIMDAKTKTSKGFGFIEMPNEENAQAAITALHGSKYGKSKLRVKQADEAA